MNNTSKLDMKTMKFQKIPYLDDISASKIKDTGTLYYVEYLANILNGNTNNEIYSTPSSKEKQLSSSISNNIIGTSSGCGGGGGDSLLNNDWDRLNSMIKDKMSEELKLANDIETYKNFMKNIQSIFHIESNDMNDILNSIRSIQNEYVLQQQAIITKDDIIENLKKENLTLLDKLTHLVKEQSKFSLKTEMAMITTGNGEIGGIITTTDNNNSNNNAKTTLKTSNILTERSSVVSSCNYTSSPNPNSNSNSNNNSNSNTNNNNNINCIPDIKSILDKAEDLAKSTKIDKIVFDNKNKKFVLEYQMKDNHIIHQNRSTTCSNISNPTVSSFGYHHHNQRNHHDQHYHSNENGVSSCNYNNHNYNQHEQQSQQHNYTSCISKPDSNMIIIDYNEYLHIIYMINNTGTILNHVLDNLKELARFTQHIIKYLSPHSNELHHIKPLIKIIQNDQEDISLSILKYKENYPYNNRDNTASSSSTKNAFIINSLACIENKLKNMDKYQISLKGLLSPAFTKLKEVITSQQKLLLTSLASKKNLMQKANEELPIFSFLFINQVNQSQ